MPYLPHHSQETLRTSTPLLTNCGSSIAPRRVILSLPRDTKAPSTILQVLTASSLALHCLLEQRNLCKPFPAWLMMQCFRKCHQDEKQLTNGESSLFYQHSRQEAPAKQDQTSQECFEKLIETRAPAALLSHPTPACGKAPLERITVGLGDTQN